MDATIVSSKLSPPYQVMRETTFLRRSETCIRLLRMELIVERYLYVHDDNAESWTNLAYFCGVTCIEKDTYGFGATRKVRESTAVLDQRKVTRTYKAWKCQDCLHYSLQG
jgi:hypothetical protein